MSAAGLLIHIVSQANSKGDRINLVLSVKFLPFKRWWLRWTLLDGYQPTLVDWEITVKIRP